MPDFSIDLDTKEAIVIGLALFAASVATIFDGFTPEQLMAIILACLAYGFGKYRAGD